MNLNDMPLVDSEHIAMALTEVYVARVYGAGKAQKQKPYLADDGGDHWVVRGSFHGPGLGGVFEIRLAKSDGRVLQLTHGR